METESWSIAQRALAEALAAAYRPSKESIRAGVAKMRDEPQELVAELASVLSEYVETNSLPNCVCLGDALNAGKAIWVEWLAGRAVWVEREKRERKRPMLRIKITRPFPPCSE